MRIQMNTQDLTNKMKDAFIITAKDYLSDNIYNEEDLRASLYFHFRQIMPELVCYLNLNMTTHKHKSEKRPDITIVEKTRSRIARVIIEIKNDNIFEKEGELYFRNPVNLTTLKKDIYKLRRYSQSENKMTNNVISCFVYYSSSGSKTSAIRRLKRYALQKAAWKNGYFCIFIFSYDDRQGFFARFKSNGQIQTEIIDIKQKIRELIHHSSPPEEAQVEDEVNIEEDEEGEEEDLAEGDIDEAEDEEDVDEENETDIDLLGSKEKLFKYCDAQGIDCPKSYTRGKIIKKILQNDQKIMKNLRHLCFKGELKKICELLGANKTGNIDTLIENIKDAIN